MYILHIALLLDPRCKLRFLVLSANNLTYEPDKKVRHYIFIYTHTFSSHAARPISE
jgi:hypothetical protein